MGMADKTDAESDDELWLKLAEAGRLSGHVVCRCPACGERQLRSYRPKSTPWPTCLLCRGPRVEPTEDMSTWTGSKRPGLPRTKRELLAAGYVPRRKESNAKTTKRSKSSNADGVRGRARTKRSTQQADPAATATPQTGEAITDA